MKRAPPQRGRAHCCWECGNRAEERHGSLWGGVCVCACPRGETQTRGGPEKGDGLWVSQTRETYSGWPQRTKTDSGWSTEKTDRLWVSQPRETDSGWPQRTEMNSAWSTEKREEALEWCKPGENKCLLCGGRRLWWGTPLYSRNGERNDL